MHVQDVTPILNVSNLHASFAWWSVRECHIRHPDGHMIRVSAHL